VWFACGLGVMTAITMVIAWRSGIGLGWFPFWALARASGQLAVVALLLRGILAAPATVAAFVVLMACTAAGTAAHRLEALWHGRRSAVAGVLLGSSTSLVAIFALGLVDLQVRYVVAVGGIIIGNAMSAATLSGRNFLRSARAGIPEIEAWLSLGATAARAHESVGQESVRESMLPNLDQTKSTGMVTLPGAFVGALFGGASPAQAAQFQLVVLAGIALAMLVTAVTVTRLLGRTPYLSGVSHVD
jgi:putative ABC transport system permease protein